MVVNWLPCPHPDTLSAIESWHIQHHQAPLNRERALARTLCHLFLCIYVVVIHFRVLVLSDVMHFIYFLYTSMPHVPIYTPLLVSVIIHWWRQLYVPKCLIFSNWPSYIVFLTSLWRNKYYIHESVWHTGRKYIIIKEWKHDPGYGAYTITMLYRAISLLCIL